MAFASRIRSTLPLINKVVIGSSTQSLAKPILQRTVTPSLELLRNFATSSAVSQKKVKVPLVLFGVHGKYCSSLYIVAVKANALDKVESELSAFVAASKSGQTISQFLRDPTVQKGIRVKAVQEIATAAKFSDITKNFLGMLPYDVQLELLVSIDKSPIAYQGDTVSTVLAADGLLKDLEKITEKFKELTMAHRGEVKATVTTVIPLPAEEEKELKDTLQYILGSGKKVLVEQKVDASILGGLIVEFDQKVFDMSIKTRALQMERFLREPINFDSL
ncbi:hypothetical protein ACFE04_003193 [Oxalis oulophora]